MKCATCKQTPRNKCYSEGFDCTGGKMDLQDYNLEENKPPQNISDSLRRECGNSLTRVEEIMRYSREAGYKKMGLAFCVGMAEEARMIAQIFEQDFKLESVCCKMSGIDKEKYDMCKIHPDKCEIACNPIGQAKMLNKAKTEINVMLGLCIGHDILFQKYSDAPVTVLAVKDRVLANNPLGVVYCSYLRDKFNINLHPEQTSGNGKTLINE